MIGGAGTLLKLRRMNEARPEVYRSSNGDIWFLGREASGSVYVEHKPNQPSGGDVSRTDVRAFLATGPQGSEHQALIALIKALAESV